MVSQKTYSPEYEQLRKQGRRYLVRGLIFLGVCFCIALFGHWLGGLLGDLLYASASVVGWVAMWRPIEIFLYDLPELKRSLKNKLNKENE